MAEKRHIAIAMNLGGPHHRDYGMFLGIRDYVEQHEGWTYEVGRYLCLDSLKNGEFDGIIGTIPDGEQVIADSIGIPVVGLHFSCACSRSLSDFHAVGRMVAEHLISRGVRRLAHFGYLRDLGSNAHYAGMREAAREHGYPCARQSVSAKSEGSRRWWERFVERVERLQSRWEPPLGIGFMNDGLCRSVTSICASLGWKIPEQLVIVGVGNHGAICNAIDPTLSSVDLGYHRYGYRSAELLNRLMQGEAEEPQTILTPPKELVVRHSSDFYVVDNEHVAQALQYMSDNAGSILSVDTIAEAVGLRRQALERRFKRYLGRSINDTLIKLRVDKLKRLLLHTEAPIKTLCTEAGFGTVVNMYTMFKRHTGMTPKEYRKEHGSL